MTTTEAITHLLAGTNWSTENIAYILGVPRQQVFEIADELGDRRLDEDVTCEPSYRFSVNYK